MKRLHIRHRRYRAVLLTTLLAFLSCTLSLQADEQLCMDGTLLFREDFGGNDPDDPRVVTTPTDIPGMTYEQLFSDAFGSMRSGGFLLTKEGYRNGNSSSQWHIQDDHTYPGDKTRGYLLEIDGRGDNAAFYTRRIEGLCAGAKLTFSAYVANVMTWGMYVGSPGKYVYPRLKFVITDPNDKELKSYDTGNIPYDPGPDSSYVKNWDLNAWQNSAEWHLVGMNFTVPEDVDEVTLTIYNAVAGSNGNDFVLDDIEIHICLSATIEGTHEVCEGESVTLEAHSPDFEPSSDPEYRWYFSADSLTWTELPEQTATLTRTQCQKAAHEGWYRVAMASSGNIDRENCRAMSEPFRLILNECGTPPPPCLDIIQDEKDTIICDFDLPYTWHNIVFAGPDTQSDMERSPRGCDSIEHIYRLDTIHCERLYPIIVNKYNWVLLVDNVAVRRLFPDKTPMTYQWFVNGTPIAGATEDDYSEDKQLCGDYQLCLTFTDNSAVWSNILFIDTCSEYAETRVKAYNSSGCLVHEWTEERPVLPSGIYLLRIEKGDEVFSQKLFVP